MKIFCDKCMYSKGTQTMCFRITAPHTPQWLNKDNNCKDFIKRWSFEHLLCLIVSNI